MNKQLLFKIPSNIVFGVNSIPDDDYAVIEVDLGKIYNALLKSPNEFKTLFDEFYNDLPPTVVPHPC